MSDYGLHPDRVASDALADAIDLCRRIRHRNDALVRVHHHTNDPTRRGPHAICGTTQDPRPLDEVMSLPCCPLCRLEMDDAGQRCVADKKDA